MNFQKLLQVGQFHTVSLLRKFNLHIKVCTAIKNVYIFKSTTAFHHISFSCSKEKKRNPKAGLWSALDYKKQNEMISNPKQPNSQTVKRVRPIKVNLLLSSSETWKRQ